MTDDDAPPPCDQLELGLLIDATAPTAEAAEVVPAWPQQVTVRRSTRRRRTVDARIVDDGLVVAIPSWMSATEEAHWVELMTERMRRHRSTERIDLPARTAQLARQYDLPLPHQVRWAGDMASRWASCTPETATIRISNRVAEFPDWVVDYVIVHELAHLVVSGHGARFWELARRYPKAERAIGYLIAKS